MSEAKSFWHTIIDKINTRDIVTVGITGLVIWAGRDAQLSQDNLFAIVMLVLGFWFGQKIGNGNKVKIDA